MKAEKLPAFALVDTPPGATPVADTRSRKDESPDLPTIKQSASSLSPGGVSDYVSTPTGGLIVVLEKREEPGRRSLKNRATSSRAELCTNRSQVVFYEWLRDRRRAAGVEEAKPRKQAPG